MNENEEIGQKSAVAERNGTMKGLYLACKILPCALFALFAVLLFAFFAAPVCSLAGIGGESVYQAGAYRQTGLYAPLCALIAFASLSAVYAVFLSVVTFAPAAFFFKMKRLSNKVSAETVMRYTVFAFYFIFLVLSSYTVNLIVADDEMLLLFGGLLETGAAPALILSCTLLFAVLSVGAEVGRCLLKKKYPSVASEVNAREEEYLREDEARFNAFALRMESAEARAEEGRLKKPVACSVRSLTGVTRVRWLLLAVVGALTVIFSVFLAKVFDMGTAYRNYGKYEYLAGIGWLDWAQNYERVFCIFVEFAMIFGVIAFFVLFGILRGMNERAWTARKLLPKSNNEKAAKFTALLPEIIGAAAFLVATIVLIACYADFLPPAEYVNVYNNAKGIFNALLNETNCWCLYAAEALLLVAQILYAAASRIKAGKLRTDFYGTPNPKTNAEPITQFIWNPRAEKKLYHEKKRMIRRYNRYIRRNFTSPDRLIVLEKDGTSGKVFTVIAEILLAVTTILCLCFVLSFFGRMY